MTDTNTASAAADLSLQKRVIFDAIRGAYDLGYRDARNARSTPGDYAPGYKGRQVEADHGGALSARIAALASAPAQPVAEPAEVSAVESNTAVAAIAAGAVYAELPMQFACSGVFPVYSADQMRAFADGTHALRTKSEASREFLERMLSAMEGVIDVADRKTAEFDALRSCVVDLTLMLFKPEALRASRGQAPAQAAPAYKDSTPELHIGGSAFESWYSTYSPAHKSDKQRARDAYAAGMGDPLVVAAHTPDRQQALRLLTQKERDSLGHRAEGMDGNEWDQWVQEKFAQVNGLKIQGGSYEWDWE